MNVYEKIIGTRLSIVVLGILGLFIAISLYYYFTGDVNVKIGALLGGVVASLVGVVIQFLLGWNEHKEVERLKRMGFLNILKNRENKVDFYSELLSKAKKEIEFVGNTGNAFLNDFAMEGDGAGDRDKLIITALRNGVNIKFLLSPRKKLSTNKKKSFDHAIEKIKRLQKTYALNSILIEHRELSDIPPFTYVRIDNVCIFGPKFPQVSSDSSPAILADTQSPFLKQYLTFFEEEWVNSSNEKN